MAEATVSGALGLSRLNTLPEAEARAALQRCCGAGRWVEGMLERRPFASVGALYSAADAVWQSLGASDYLEAFSHHPEIEEDLEELRRRFGATAELSRAEQSGAAGAAPATLLSLRAKNRAYRERFGFLFIVCANGKSATEMLALLEQRLHHSPDAELAIAAGEQAKITRLRLEKLVA